MSDPKDAQRARKAAEDLYPTPEGMPRPLCVQSELSRDKARPIFLRVIEETKAECDERLKMSCPDCLAIAPENEKDWPDTQCAVCILRAEVERLNETRAEAETSYEAFKGSSEANRLRLEYAALRAEVERLHLLLQRAEALLDPEDPQQEPTLAEVRAVLEGCEKRESDLEAEVERLKGLPAVVKRCCPDCCQHCYDTAIEAQEIMSGDYQRGRREGAREMRERAAHWTSKQWAMHSCYTAEELADAIRALPDEPEAK